MKKSALLLAAAISWFGQTAALKADHHETHLIDELKDASWQLGTWKWEGSGDDKSGKGFVTFKAVMGGQPYRLRGIGKTPPERGPFYPSGIMIKRERWSSTVVPTPSIKRGKIW